MGNKGIWEGLGIQSNALHLNMIIINPGNSVWHLTGSTTPQARTRHSRFSGPDAGSLLPESLRAQVMLR